MGGGFGEDFWVSANRDTGAPKTVKAPSKIIEIRILMTLPFIM